MAQHGIIAKKVGMSRYFDSNGKHVPVTLLSVQDCQVTQVKTAEKDGYTAVQLGVFNVRENRTSKPMIGHFKKAGVQPKAKLAEFRVNSVDGLTVGSEIKADVLSVGQLVDVAGITIGRGFAGVMKRWNFAGLRATHGVSVSHRSHGSTGQRQDPGKVMKGKKMAGHMGQARRTQQNIEVIQVDADKGLIVLKGSVPGAEGSMVLVQPAVKVKTAAAKK